MIGKVLPVVFLLVAGCSEPTLSKTDKNDQGTVSPEKSVAILSCSINGTLIGVSACIIGGGNTTSGSLKISSGGTVKQYTDYDLVRENGRTLELPLTAPFTVTAQANSDEGYVLHLVIRQGSKTVFQNEATQFGVMETDSTTLG